MVEFGTQSSQTRLDVPKAVAISQLSESHAQKLIETREALDFVIAPIAVDTFSEFVERKKVQQLGEDGASMVHRPLPPVECNGSSVPWI